VTGLSAMSRRARGWSLSIQPAGTSGLHPNCLVNRFHELVTQPEGFRSCFSSRRRRPFDGSSLLRQGKIGAGKGVGPIFAFFARRNRVGSCLRFNQESHEKNNQSN
jgi:hypothetical protein